MQRSFPNTSQADLKRVFESVVYSEKAKEFFFPNALDAVALASKKGYRKLLLSYGDVAYKTRFFTYCGIDAHFSPEEIVITNEKKNDMVATLPLEPSVIIVNDVADETRGMITALQDSGHKVKAFLFAPDPEVSLDGLESFFSFSTLQHSL